jgi:hypothetical protein
MRNPVPPLLIVVVTAAGVACSRGGATPQQDAAVGETGAMGHVHQRVSLSGCVQAAPGFNEFVLHKVTFPSDEPRSEDLMKQEALIPEGSWVRLKAGKADPKGYLGQRVSVTGQIIDAGENTIGTSSRRSQHPTDRAMPPSTVPPPAADANGAPPEILVDQISPLLQRCDAEGRR